MNAPKRTSGARHIEQLLQQLPPESQRYRILDSARRFKSSWVELGEWLARLHRSGEYRAWGFSSFEDYCSKEIRIRRQTAEKLLLAFRFLEHREPQLLERKADRPLPDYRSVDLLRQADEEQQLNDADYSALRTTILEDERSHPQVARQYRDILQQRQPSSEQGRLRCRTALSAARRLSTGLQDLDAVPERFRHTLDELVGYLEERLMTEAPDEKPD